MSEIKYIIFDSNMVDNAAIEQSLNTLCSSIYKIKDGQFLVCYRDTSQTLYNNLRRILNNQRILIFDVNRNEYFGLHDSNLWSWMINQFRHEHHQ